MVGFKSGLPKIMMEMEILKVPFLNTAFCKKKMFLLGNNVKPTEKLQKVVQSTLIYCLPDLPIKMLLSLLWHLSSLSIFIYVHG